MGQATGRRAGLARAAAHSACPWRAANSASLDGG